MEAPEGNTKECSFANYQLSEVNTNGYTDIDASALSFLSTDSLIRIIFRFDYDLKNLHEKMKDLRIELTSLKWTLIETEEKSKFFEKAYRSICSEFMKTSKKSVSMHTKTEEIFFLPSSNPKNLSKSEFSLKQDLDHCISENKLIWNELKSEKSQKHSLLHELRFINNCLRKNEELLFKTQLELTVKTNKHKFLKLELKRLLRNSNSQSDRNHSLLDSNQDNYLNLISSKPKVKVSLNRSAHLPSPSELDRNLNI